MLPALSLNGAVFDLLNDDIAGRAQPVDDLMKFFAKYAIYLVVALLAASWFIRDGRAEDRRIAVYSAIAAGALALAIGWLVQQWYVHPRPFVVRPPNEYVLLLDHAPDASFPSDHATVAFGIGMALALYRWRFGVLMLAIATVIAFARVYVGVHYPGDVLGGALIGIMAALAARGARPIFSYLDQLIVLRLVPEPLR